MLNKLAAVIYPRFLKKQPQKPLLYLLFEENLSTNGLQDISFLVLKSI